MKKLFIVLGSLILLSACSGNSNEDNNTQEPPVKDQKIYLLNEVKTLGYKGDVKKLVSYTYDVQQDASGTWQIINPEDYSMLTVNFDNTGRRISMKGISFNNGDTYNSSNHYSYSETDTSVVVSTFSDGEDEPDISTVVRNGANSFKTIGEPNIDNYKLETMYSVDNTGRLVEFEMIGSRGTEVRTHYKNTTSYDDNTGNWKETSTDFSDNTSSSTEHIVLERDEKGNPTKKVVVSSNPFMLVNSYEYH